MLDLCLMDCLFIKRSNEKVIMWSNKVLLLNLYKNHVNVGKCTCKCFINVNGGFTFALSLINGITTSKTFTRKTMEHLTSLAYCISSEI